VRSVCLIAVLDRAGVQPVHYDPKADEAVDPPKFDPTLCTSEELDQIECALRLMVDRMNRPERGGAIGRRSSNPTPR
jgi:hypothetical protein